MGWNRAKYPDVRELMQPGDVVAFGGNCLMSDIFKYITRSCVSHSGVIIQKKLVLDNTPQDGIFNEVMESTEYKGFIGVQHNRLSQVIRDYDGNVWWLPLSDETREKLDMKNFFDFMIHQNGKPFDLADSAELMFETFIRHQPNIREDFSKFFCSELVVAGLEAGNALPPIDASDITPADLVKFNIYSGDYYQLKGKNKKIKKYNTRDPESFC